MKSKILLLVLFLTSCFISCKKNNPKYFNENIGGAWELMADDTSVNKLSIGFNGAGEFNQYNKQNGIATLETYHYHLEGSKLIFDTIVSNAAFSTSELIIKSITRSKSIGQYVYSKGKLIFENGIVFQKE